MISSTPADGGNAGAKKSLVKQQIRHDLLQLSAPMFAEFMIKVKSFLKDAILCDPDMWPSVKSSVGTAVDQFLDDVEHEIERNLQDAFLQKKPSQDNSVQSKYRVLQPLYNFRAFVLYHYLPHDKMMFGRLSDPVFLVMYLLTFLPIHGVRIVFFSMVLLMLTLPGPPDEYQLINFILLCKGMQFLSSGICQLAKGAILYFFCYISHRDELHPERLMTCIDNYGPGAKDGYGLAMDYLGSIMLVWVAFGLMSRSKKHAADQRASFESKAQGDRKNKEAGGRFRTLLGYDRKCFAASVFLLLLLVLPQLLPRVWATGLHAIIDLHGDPEFNASVFWCCVLYSLLSLPFFPFMIAGLQEVMTHCYATGFNPHGACVAYEGVAMAAEEIESPSRPPMRRGGTLMMGGAAHFLKIMQSGAQYRNEESLLHYKPGDLFRGVYNEYYKKPHEAKKQQQEERAKQQQEVQTEGGISSHWNEFGRKFGGVGGFSKKYSLEEEVVESEDDGEDYGEPMHFSIASANIPADKMQEDYGGSAAFVVEVAAGLGLDGEAAASCEECSITKMTSNGTITNIIQDNCSKWYVVRRFKEFEVLAERLGPRCKQFPNAPFPARSMLSGPVKGSQLEQRRSQLEAWLTQVMEDKRCCQTRWNKEMTNFLKENSWQQADIEHIIRRSGGGSTNLPQQLSEEVMSGPLERARPLARHAKQGKALIAPQEHLQQTVAAGRKARGGVADGHYQFGDYTRGLVSGLAAGASTASCTRPPARLATTTFEDDFEGQDLDSSADMLRLATGNQPL